MALIKNIFKRNNVNEDEIISMVNEGHEKGVFEASEAEMITNIFEFGDKKFPFQTGESYLFVVVNFAR